MMAAVVLSKKIEYYARVENGYADNRNDTNMMKNSVSSSRLPMMAEQVMKPPRRSSRLASVAREKNQAPPPMHYYRVRWSSGTDTNAFDDEGDPVQPFPESPYFLKLWCSGSNDTERTYICFVRAHDEDRAVQMVSEADPWFISHSFCNLGDEQWPNGVFHPVGDRFV